MKAHLCVPKDQSASPRHVQRQNTLLAPFTLTPQKKRAPEVFFPDCDFPKKPPQDNALAVKSIQMLTDQWIARFKAGTASPIDLANSIAAVFPLRGASRVGSPQGYSEIFKKKQESETLNTSAVSQKRIVSSSRTSPMKTRTKASRSPPVHPRGSEERPVDVARICLVSLYKATKAFAEAVEPVVRTQSDHANLLWKVQSLLEFCAHIVDDLSSSHSVPSQVFSNLLETLTSGLEKEKQRSETLLVSLQSAQHSARTESHRDKQVIEALIATNTAQTEAKFSELTFQMKLVGNKTVALRELVGKLAEKQRSLRLAAAEEKQAVLSKEAARGKTYEALYYRAQNAVFKLQKELVEAKRQHSEESILELELQKLKSETISVTSLLEHRNNAEITIERLQMRAADLESRLSVPSSPFPIRGLSDIFLETESRKSEFPWCEGSCECKEQTQMQVEDFASAFRRLTERYRAEMRRMQERMEDLEAENSVLGCENSFLNKECEDLRGTNGSFCEFGKLMAKKQESPRWDDFYEERPAQSERQSETAKLRQLVSDLQQTTETLQQRLQERDPTYHASPGKCHNTKWSCGLVRAFCAQLVSKITGMKGKEDDGEFIKTTVAEVLKLWSEFRTLHTDVRASSFSPETARKLTGEQNTERELQIVQESEKGDFVLCTLNESEILAGSAYLRVLKEVQYEGKVWQLVKNADGAFAWLTEHEEDLLANALREKQQLIERLMQAESQEKLLSEIEVLAGTRDSVQILEWIRSLARSDWSSSNDLFSPPISTCAQSVKGASEMKSLYEELTAGRAAKHFQGSASEFQALKELVLTFIHAADVRGKDMKALASALCQYFGEEA